MLPDVEPIFPQIIAQILFRTWHLGRKSFLLYKHLDYGNAWTLMTTEMFNF